MPDEFNRSIESPESPESHASDPFTDLTTYCMFFGYPRSGHTLVGSLINAHPEALISHELDALSQIRDGISRRGLFEAILAGDREFAARDRQHTDYDYAVPGAWHGRWERLRVIGDKKGGRSSWWLHDEPELLPRLITLVDLPIRYFHVSRSPWDNIATMVRRGLTHERAIEWYFETCDAVAGIKARIPADQVFDLRHEDLVAEPRDHLRAIARFLGIEVREAWVEACAARVNPRPNRSRHELEWSPAQRDRVRHEVQRFPWFRDEDRDFDAAP